MVWRNNSHTTRTCFIYRFWETDVWIFILIWSQSMVFKWHSPEILENSRLSKNDKFPRRATGQLAGEQTDSLPNQLLKATLPFIVFLCFVLPVFRFHEQSFASVLWGYRRSRSSRAGDGRIRISGFYCTSVASLWPVLTISQSVTETVAS